MSSKGLSKGKTKSSRAMEHLKNHNTSLPRQATHQKVVQSLAIPGLVNILKP